MNLCVVICIESGKIVFVNILGILISKDDFIIYLQVCKKFGKIVCIGQQNEFLLIRELGLMVCR